MPGLLAHGVFESHGRFALLSVWPFTAQSLPSSELLPRSGFAAATMASADFSLRPRRVKGFRSRGLSPGPASLLDAGVTLSGTSEISPGKRHGLRCTVAGYTPHPFGRESFAAVRPLTLGCTASNPISVRRPTASALHFLQPEPRGPHVVVCLRSLRPSSSQDFHLLVMSHAGRTNQAAGTRQLFFLRTLC